MSCIGLLVHSLQSGSKSHKDKGAKENKVTVFVAEGKEVRCDFRLLFLGWKYDY